MADPSDSELRALLDAASTPEGEESLAELVEESPGLRERLAFLSGAEDFNAHFDPSEPRAESTPELRELISSIQCDPELSSAPVSPSPISQSMFLEMLEPSDDPSALGSLGSYLIEEMIAAGGMGVVYRGRDPELERTVAIKMLSPALAGSEEAKERFQREAKAAAAIEHPNVIAIYAVDQVTAALPFLVMRYIEGETLGQRMERAGGKPLPVEETVRIAKGIAAGLSAAHQQGLIHRDVKPSNILLEGDGPGVWITDFGLARAGADPGLTRSNIFVGTPEFAAPEQAQGQEVDHRSDLFSFGALLYLMATGRRPFEGESFATLVYRIVHEAHRAAGEANPDLPAWVANLIDRLLAKDPAERYQSAREVMTDLEREKAMPGPVPGAGNRGKRLRLVGAGVGVMILLGIGVWLAFWSPAARKDPTPVAPGIVLLGGSEGVGSRRFASLGAAVVAADSGGVIEIDTSDPLPPEQIEIPAGKFLTIRAAPDRRPVLQADSTSTLIFTRAPLILEGLTFEQAAGRPTPDSAILTTVEAPLFVANCRFLRGPGDFGMGPQRNMVPPFLAIFDLPEGGIRNCEVYAPDSSCVGVSARSPGTGSLSIENCVFMGMSALLLKNDGTEQPEVTFTRNASVVRSLLSLQFKNAGAAGFAVSAQGNILSSRNFCFLNPNMDDKDFSRLLSWSGRSNLYAVRNRFLMGTGLRGIPQWELPDLVTWIEAETGSRELSSYDPRDKFSLQSIEDLRGLAPAALVPPPSQVGDSGTDGPDLDLVGPGEAYHRWWETEAYRKWAREARAACLRVPAREAPP